MNNYIFINKHLSINVKRYIGFFHLYRQMKTPPAKKYPPGFGKKYGYKRYVGLPARAGRGSRPFFSTPRLFSGMVWNRVTGIA
ncbi:hypothetical protein SAMN06269250_1603 [Spirosoma fluviale]|uniref:Uncharacterized protein n=1 Tax=Spirosoma fluviale TaxID=1597977 RepID=A0A286FCC7_9BACT|nr:hypothetical protein SAMN06269250_1603 [Spirosoma fluviale]